MKRLFICAAMLFVGAMCAEAQTKDGGIDSDMLSRIRQAMLPPPSRRQSKMPLHLILSLRWRLIPRT